MGGGVLEHQQLTVCLLGEQELQETSEDSWELEGLQGTHQFLDALAQVSRASPFLRWKNKGSRERPRMWSWCPVSHHERRLWTDCWFLEEVELGD